MGMNLFVSTEFGSEGISLENLVDEYGHSAGAKNLNL